MTQNTTQKKSEIRKIFKEKRAAMNVQEVMEKSKKINQNFIDNLLPKIYAKNSGKIFSVYKASGNEASCDLIIEHFKKNKIDFAYPKIVAKDSALEFVLADAQQKFAENKLYKNIFEPIDGKKISPDILIIPLLAFDEKLTRLGMGGGFYDRTIEFLKSKKEILTIGLGYNWQLSLQILQKENTDETLDFIVSEQDILSREPVTKLGQHI